MGLATQPSGPSSQAPTFLRAQSALRSNLSRFKSCQNSTYANKKPRTRRGSLFDMARLGGFEPPTAWFVARYSIQLSYSRLKHVGSDFVINGAAGRIRTSDRLVRSQVLYPAELQPRNKTFQTSFFYSLKKNGGEGGIRTLGTRNAYGSLAGSWFQPLTHLSLRTRHIVPEFFCFHRVDSDFFNFLCPGFV